MPQLDPSLQGKTSDEILANPQLAAKFKEHLKSARKGFNGVQVEDQVAVVNANRENQKKLATHLESVATLRGQEGLRAELDTVFKFSLYNSKRGLWAGSALIRELFRLDKPHHMVWAFVGLALLGFTLASIATLVGLAGGGDFIAPHQRMYDSGQQMFQNDR